MNTPALFLDGKIEMHAGDSREVLKTLPDNSVDACVCDPPYGLGFMGRAWDAPDGAAFAAEFWAEVLRVLKPGAHVVAFSGTRTYHRMAVAIEDAGFEIRDQIGWLYGTGFPKSRKVGDGWGTALKPAWEPICLARKPLVGTVAENVLQHGTGAINIDGCRIPTADSLGGGAEKSVAVNGKHEGWTRPWMHDADAVAAHAERVTANVAKAEALGRWPANIVHDGSDEVVAAFPTKGDLSEARFFYSAKADADDRLGSKHPTVKPVDLMQWLVRLVAPKGGTVLDPFAGTGTTGEACFREGMRCILIEREEEYQADIRRRMELVMAGASQKRARLTRQTSPGDLPLFGGV